MNIVDKLNSISTILTRFDEQTWEKEYLTVVELEKLYQENILSMEKIETLKERVYQVTIVGCDGEERKSHVVPLEDILECI